MLDDKLREILDGPDGPIIKDDEVKQAIAQLKQVFSEAGWTFMRHAYHDNKTGDSVELMTGRQWYDRFKVELHLQVFPEGREGAAILQAARRAAGL